MLVVNCFKIAQKSGCIEAYEKLGDCLETECGFKENSFKATTYFIKSVEAGYSNSLVKLGLKYALGIGTNQSKEQAILCFSEACEYNLDETRLCLS